MATLEDESASQVALILLDDHVTLTYVIAIAYERSGKKLKVYSSPYQLLEEISFYPKVIKICTVCIRNCVMTGLDVAKILHEQGFSNLYLATGRRFRQEDMPDYIHLLKDKADILGL